MEQAAVITPDMLMQVLVGLPLAKEYTAYLAVKAFRSALAEIDQRRQSTRLPNEPRFPGIHWIANFRRPSAIAWL